MHGMRQRVSLCNMVSLFSDRADETRLSGRRDGEADGSWNVHGLLIRVSKS